MTGSTATPVPVEGPPSDSSAPTPAVIPSTGTPDETVQSYFAAINKKSWSTVWALGGKNVNDSYQSMIDGYAHTAEDNAYVYSVTDHAVRLALLARSDTGVVSLYVGTYTVGSGVITSGSLSLQNRLHDSRAAIGDFAGDWVGHGRGITIAAGGIGVLTYRTYAECSQSTSKPCDDVIGSDIYDGGLTIFQITSVTGDSAAATNLFTTEARKVPLALQRQPGAGTITINTVDAPFCDPAADNAGTCGL